MDTSPLPDAGNALIMVISDELREFIHSRSSTFACGGSIPTSVTNTHPVILRWDSPNNANDISKLEFPIKHDHEPTLKSLLSLAQDCQPASFGYKGNNVIDESYRKATKMDRSDFSVDFCPYELGIVDTIAQLLLPNYDDSTLDPKNRIGTKHGTKGVKAELYKLNIYEAPSGFFKAHVDTPRSDHQFGSLVVSLPCQHEGGQLIVRHAEHSVTFDWGSSGPNKLSKDDIQWAAFYSDCEHEVLEVTSGHRITLTYNLYYVSGVGDLAGHAPAMEVKSLPLYQKLKSMLEEPDFMRGGGTLGIYCQHAYAHSTVEGAAALPGILKGSDMALYAVFLALGLAVSVHPILAHRDSYGFHKYMEWYEEISAMNREHMAYEKRILECGDSLLKHTYVGNLDDTIKLTAVGGYEEPFPEISKAWGGVLRDVTWVDTPNSSNKNVGFVHGTYGNEAGTDWMYTYAALLVKIPDSYVRAALAQE